MATRYGKGDIVKLKKAEGEFYPTGKAEIVEVHDLGKGKKTNYGIEFFDERMDDVGIFSASELELVERSGGPRGKMTKVRADEFISEFIGPDGNKQGPISKGETATIPTRNAKVMEKRGKVTII